MYQSIFWQTSTRLSVLGLLGLLSTLLRLLAIVVVLGAALLAGRGWHIENGLLLVLCLELLFYYFLFSSAGVRAGAGVALSCSQIGALSSRLLLCFGFFVIVGIISLIATAIADSKTLVVVAWCRSTLAEAIITINLLELGAETLFSLWWREELLQFLNSFSNLVFVARIVSQGDAEHLAHIP